MQFDFLIIGQGISGTWLSYYLQKEGKSFLVIDNNISNAPSRVAAGIINPVTGRRHAEVWMDDKLLPFAWEAYNIIGDELGIKAISQKNIIDFFPSVQMRLSFQQRVEEAAEYVSIPEDENRFLNLFNYELGFGEIKPVYTAHLENILPAWRQLLLQKKSLIEEDFDISLLQLRNDEVQYGDITAKKIIFCDGASCGNNPWFSKLPFAPNKGEALTLRIDDLPTDHIYKNGLTLAPLATPGFWWIGSAYEWEFSDVNPTKAFREKAESLLKEWLKLPYEITCHYASLRPATLERRPFVGFHPLYTNIGILNGMGTKGCSLAPYFAMQLAENILYDKPITAEASIGRFKKILSTIAS